MDCRNSIRVSGNLAGDLQKALNDHDAANSIRCFLIKPDCTSDLCVRDKLLGLIGGDAGLIMPSKPFSALLFIHQREVGLGAFNYLLPEARRIAQFIKAYRKKKTDFNIRVYGEVLKAQLSESSIIQRLSCSMRLTRQSNFHQSGRLPGPTISNRNPWDEKW